MTEHHHRSLTSLAGDLRLGRLALTAYLDWLQARFDAREPEVLAFLPEQDRFERLRRQATDLEARFPEPASRPPLYGVAVGVKDIFHAEGFATQAGSRLPVNILRGPEAASVTALKNAGVLLLGKTVTTEFAYFAPGPTRNPHNPAHTPGGSSSGSAAAVGAGLCPLALGTQTIGSVIRPASFCGVVGFKPTYGRIPAEGVIPLSLSLDHVGFFTPDVAGAGLAASILLDGWQDAPPPRDRPVLGIPEGPYLERASATGLDHFRRTVDRLAAAGFDLRPVQAMPDFDDIYQRHNALTAAEAARFHAAWFERYAGLYHPKTADLLQRGQSVSDEALETYRAGRDVLYRHLAALMDEHGLDAWICPAAVGPAPFGLDSTGDPVMNLPWTQAGMPALNLPAGLAAGGLPLGLQVVARRQADEHLLAWGQTLAAHLPVTG